MRTVNLRLVRWLVGLVVLLAAPSVWGDPSVATDHAYGVYGESGYGGVVDEGSGAMRYTVPFLMPRARGDAQPSLALTYDSSSGDREAGLGWGLDLPVIERRALTGWATLGASTDRFSYSGSPLVRVCVVPSCPATEGPFPAWATGWTYYVQRFDSARRRFFVDANETTWRVQSKGGVETVFGAPVSMTELGGNPAYEFEIVPQPGDPQKKFVHRWYPIEMRQAKAARDGDAADVAFRWQHLGDDARLYLTDIWDTPPLSPALALYAHHTQLSWESHPFAVAASAHVDRRGMRLRLQRVAVSSHTWVGDGNREVLRIYRLN